MAAEHFGEAEAVRIARGLHKRDLAVLSGLVDEFQLRLARYLIYLVGREEPVDDLLQETWIRVLERGRQYDGRSRFEPWLFTIARHLAFDYLRRKGNRAGEPASSEPIFAGPSPFELAARTEDATRLASSLDQLSPLSREALFLRFQEELTLQEIAKVVNAPLTTVSSRIQRGLAELRPLLATGKRP